MPHEFEEGGKYQVSRIYPDSIMLKSNAGLKRLKAEEMSVAMREKYFIFPETAREYRKIMAERRQKALAKQAAINRNAQIERDNRAKAQAQADSYKKAETLAEQKRQAAQAWARYDSAMRVYNAELIRAKKLDRASGRVVKMPRRPTMPRVPRP